jgi:hypothetical protein
METMAAGRGHDNTPDSMLYMLPRGEFVSLDAGFHVQNTPFNFITRVSNPAPQRCNLFLLGDLTNELDHTSSFRQATGYATQAVPSYFFLMFIW